MVAAGAEREHDERLARRVDQLAALVGCNPCRLALADLVLVALDQQREPAREHDVDLLLLRVAVDAPALPRLQPEQVDAERRGAELTAQRLKALVAVERQRHDLHAGSSRRRRPARAASTSRTPCRSPG